MSKKNVWLFVIIFIIILFIVLIFYCWQRSISQTAEPLSYETNGISVSVIRDTKPFNYTAEQLFQAAIECGTERNLAYFNDLILKFKNSNQIVYNFKYLGESQGTGNFVVTLLPNKADYKTLTDFKKDFDQCYAGGDAYPFSLNNNWLLFTSSCGSGMDDGSGFLNGCQELREVIEPTLKLN